ncbi:MAG: PAS domain-containing sensor histidine kinase [Reichenbachiella sp.]|uniref:sensor histidine kinase n=1 Tax=Reichenbachiella sp. TaxID=2184521 RepID=UPI0032632C1B
MKQKDLLAQLEHTNDRLWSFDPDLNCTFTNTNMSEDFYHAFGIRLAPGVCVLQNVPEPLRTFWNERYQRALAGEKFGLVEHFEIEGVPEYVEVSFNPVIEDDMVTGVACSSKDISKTKRAEIQLKQSEANLYAQIENTSDSIWSVNRKYEMVTMNSVFQKEFSQAFRCDLKIKDRIISYLPRSLKTVWRGRYDRALSGERFEVVDKFEYDDKARYVEISYNPVQIEGKIVGVTCFTRDITALKTSELELKKAVDTRDKFFSIIAHDLRGPIANIHQLAQVLKLNESEMKKNNEALEMLANSAGSVHKLLENLLNWALSQQGIIELKQQTLNLGDLINEGIAPYRLSAELKNLTVDVDIEADLSVRADKPTATSIIANLFNNATKYTPEKGNIRISASAHGKAIAVKIEDNGVGMSADKVAAILAEQGVESTPGTQAEKGTGLGLTLCKEFVRLNNGKFALKSTEGNGSCFEFTLEKA